MGILQHMQNLYLYKNISSLLVAAKCWKQWKCLLIADWLQLSQYIINRITKVQNYTTALERIKECIHICCPSGMAHKKPVTMVILREGNEWLDDKDERGFYLFIFLMFFTVCLLVSLNLVLMYIYYSEIETIKKKKNIVF